MAQTREEGASIGQETSRLQTRQESNYDELMNKTTFSSSPTNSANLKSANSSVLQSLTIDHSPCLPSTVPLRTSFRTVANIGLFQSLPMLFVPYLKGLTFSLSALSLISVNNCMLLNAIPAVIAPTTLWRLRFLPPRTVKHHHTPYSAPVSYRWNGCSPGLPQEAHGRPVPRSLHRDPSSEDRDQPAQASPVHRGWFHVGGMPLREPSIHDGNLLNGTCP